MIHRTILIFFVITVVSSISSYGQSSSNPFEDEGGSKTKQTTTSELPPSISGSASSSISILSYPNPSRGIFWLSISNSLRDYSAAVAEKNSVPSDRKRPFVFVKIVKHGSQKPVFILRETYPLKLIVDLTKFGQGTYYLTVSTDNDTKSQRLLVE